MAKAKRKTKKVAKRKKFPAEQRDYEVGNKKPPKEHQFKAGESGNPNGPPRRRTQLWVWFCKYMSMTDTQLKGLVKKKLTQSQQTALKLATDMVSGKYTSSERLARHVFDREEGKAVEHVIIGNDDVLTDSECENIRKELLKHADK